MDSPWPQLKRWIVNGAIVGLLFLLVCDSLPFTPGAVGEWVTPIVNRLGFGNGPWSMFAPPDRVNHRLRAEITLRDGRVIPHPFPELTQQTRWQRLVGHRQSEYVDNAIVVGQQHRDVWNYLADWLARAHAHEGGGVAQVRIIVELAPIPPPEEGSWPPPRQVFPFDDQRVVYREKYR